MARSRSRRPGQERDLPARRRHGRFASRAHPPRHEGQGRPAGHERAALRGARQHRSRSIPTRPSPTRQPVRPRSRAASGPTTAPSASMRTDDRCRRCSSGHARSGKATGLVTTAQVTDASPAAFGAHVPDRAQQSEIARQFLEQSKPDVILGGGEDRWLPPGVPGAYPDNPPKDPTEQSSSDRGNLIERAADARLRVRLGPCRRCAAAAHASCSACSPTRRCSSSAPRARATSTSPWCRSTR